MAISNAALEDAEVPPPEGSSTTPQPTRDMDPNAPAISDKNYPGAAPFHQHPRPEGFHVFPQEKGLPPTPPIDQPDVAGTGYWQERNPPPESNEPFIPSQRRPHDQWAVPDFSRGSPYMPRPQDFAPLLHRVVMGFGRWGSHYTGMPAIAMGTYANAYWQAYQKGMKERAADNWQKYREARQMTLDRAKEEILKAKEGIALYGKDPARLKQYYQQMATQYQDQALANALAISPAAVDELWAVRDTHWHDLAKQQEAEERKKLLDEDTRQRMEERRIRMENEKQKREALERARRAIDPNAVGPGPDYKPDFGPEPEPGPRPEPGSVVPPEPDEGPDETPGETPGSEPATSGEAEPDTTPASSAAGGEPPAGQKPIQMADASGQVPFPSTPTRGVPGQAPGQAQAQAAGPEGREETPVIEEAARNWVTTHKLPGSFKPFADLSARAEARGTAIESYLNKLANDPKKTGDDVRREVGRLLPGLAKNLEGYVSGDQPPPGRIGSTNQAYWNLVFALGKKIDPNFTASTFAERFKAKLFWTQGPGGNKLTTIGTAFDHLLDLRRLAIEGKKPGQLTHGFTEWWATHFGEIGEIDTLRGKAIHEMENALAASPSGGGTATIPALRTAIADMTYNQSDKNFLKRVDENIAILTQRLGEMYHQFESSTGQKPEMVRQRFEDYARRAAPAMKDLDPGYSSELAKAPDALERLMQYKADQAGSAGGKSSTGGKVIDYKDYFK